MQPSSGIKTWQWVVTVIVIIVLIIIGISVFSNKTPVTNTEDTTPVTDNSNTPGALNRVVMADQYPGNVAYLTSVQLAKPGFVVIHANNAGVPGAVLGSTYFKAGINPGSIKLSAAMVEGGTYYAMLHDDTNGNGKWDGEAIDLPLKDANGSIIMKPFKSGAAASQGQKG